MYNFPIDVVVHFLKWEHKKNYIYYNIVEEYILRKVRFYGYNRAYSS